MPCIGGGSISEPTKVHFKFRTASPPARLALPVSPAPLRLLSALGRIRVRVYGSFGCNLLIARVILQKTERAAWIFRRKATIVRKRASARIELLAGRRRAPDKSPAEHEVTRNANENKQATLYRDTKYRSDRKKHTSPVSSAPYPLK